MTSNIIKFVHCDQIIEVENPDPNETLLNYIRTNLKKTGTKEGCAEGGCGACTIVLGELKNNNVNYSAVNSCITFLPTIAGKQLILVEDLISKDNSLHPVQKAMVKYHGSQCGFCTPGMIMAAEGLLRRIPDPEEDEIRKALAANICRCTGYVKIIEAVQFAATEIKNAEINRKIPAKLVIRTITG